MNRRNLVLLLAAGLSMGRSPVDPANHDRAGAAVHGYDVVSYFTDGKPAKGDAQFVKEWMGVKWLFATDAHRTLFIANPEKYAPQFGGYCAWAVGHNYTADVDPEAWTILDRKLYLNYNKDVQRKWDSERGKWIQEAERNWPGLHR